MYKHLLLASILAGVLSPLSQASVIYTLTGSQYFDYATFQYVAPDFVTSSIHLEPSQLSYCTFDAAPCTFVSLGVSSGGDSLGIGGISGSDGVSGFPTTQFNTFGTYSDEILSLSVEPGVDTPEPATLLLSALPLIGLVILRRRKT